MASEGCSSGGQRCRVPPEAAAGGQQRVSIVHLTGEQLGIGSRRGADAGDITGAAHVQDLDAVEHVFNARTVWFSEFNEPVACVFGCHCLHYGTRRHHPPLDWSQVEPMDRLIGGCLSRCVHPSASASARRQALARGCGRTWPQPSACSNPNGTSSRTSEGCCPTRNEANPRRRRPSITQLKRCNPVRRNPSRHGTVSWHVGDDH